MDYNQNKEAELKNSEAKDQDSLKNFVMETVDRMNTLPLPMQNEFMRSVTKITIEQRTNKVKELDAESNGLKKSLDDLINSMTKVNG